jgi:hypothetical protein
MCPGKWVVHVRFTSLTACAVAGSEVNFRVDTH